MINHCGKIVRLFPDVQAWCQNDGRLLVVILLLKYMQLVRVFQQVDNLAEFGCQLFVNGRKYPCVPILLWCEKIVLE